MALTAHSFFTTEVLATGGRDGRAGGALPWVGAAPFALGDTGRGTGSGSGSGSY